MPVGCGVLFLECFLLVSTPLVWCGDSSAGNSYWRLAASLPLPGSFVLRRSSSQARLFVKCSFSSIVFCFISVSPLSPTSKFDVQVPHLEASWHIHCIACMEAGQSMLAMPHVVDGHSPGQSFSIPWSIHPHGPGCFFFTRSRLKVKKKK